MMARRQPGRNAPALGVGGMPKRTTEGDVMSTELQVMRPQTTGLEMFDTTTMKRGDTELPLMEE